MTVSALSSWRQTNNCITFLKYLSSIPKLIHFLKSTFLFLFKFFTEILSFFFHIISWSILIWNRVVIWKCRLLTRRFYWGFKKKKRKDGKAFLFFFLIKKKCAFFPKRPSSNLDLLFAFLIFMCTKTLRR